MRRFEIISKYEQGDITLPVRGSEKSAGYDFFAIEDCVIKAHETQVLLTGIKALMEDDEVLEIYIRSSLAFKKNLILLNNVGIIDADYYNNSDNEGHIMIGLRNSGDEDVEIKKGERFAQGIFKKYLVVEGDSVNKKRNGGFGSTND